MIIQIQDKTKRWFNRCKCETQEIAEKELAYLKKIYIHNKFRMIPGKVNAPGPKYHAKSEQEIKTIVKGLSKAKSPDEIAKVLRGEPKIDPESGVSYITHRTIRAAVKKAGKR